MDGIQWKYLHQMSNSKNGNSASELFDLKKYTTAMNGYTKVKLENQKNYYIQA